MLSPADAAFVAGDGAIPGLATLLDPDASVAALQAALPETEVMAAEATYVRYKPGANCLVGYHMTTPHGAIRAYARAFAPELRSKLDHARKLHDQAGSISAGGGTLDDLGIAVYAWPYDHELKALKQLVDPAERARLLKRLTADQPRLRRASLHDLRYKPERRYVGQIVAAGGQRRLIKLYDAGDYAPAREAAAAFHSRGPLRLAERLGHDDRRHALLFAWLPGRPLQELLREPSCSLDPVRMVGAALGELHGQQPKHLPVVGRQAEATALHAAADAIAAVHPGLGVRARLLATSLAAELARMPPRNTPIHGDFYADQVLLAEEHAALVDLDNAAYGDPGADIGSFAAHLHRDALRGWWTLDWAERVTEALLAGYHVDRPANTSSLLGVYTAAGLLRLAPEPFRYRELHWPERMEALLAHAEEIATRDYVTT